MLKYEFVDLVYCNCMHVYTNNDGKCVTSSDIDEYLASEQHRLNIVNQVTMEDMKMENQYYCNLLNTVITERIHR